MKKQEAYEQSSKIANLVVEYIKQIFAAKSNAVISFDVAKIDKKSMLVLVL